MAKPQSCPDDSQLQALLDGNLPKEEQAVLAMHLESCGECRKRLESVAGEDEVIPQDAPSSSAAASRSEALAEAIRRLKAETADQAETMVESSVGPPSLQFLSPSTNPRHLGRLAGYEVLEVIGRGGMGTVLKARDSKLERLVAIKVLNPELAANGSARARFLREARSAAAVTHEHVVTIHAVDEANDVPFLVMEYVLGVSLEDRIQRSGHLRVEEILRIGMQTASGLAAAHAQGLVHRDIKPSNILLENGVERVKITDFGLARVIHEAQLTQSNVVAGTPQYMSPEQARGESVDHRSDLFSLGCVLYAMCTGRSPFRADTPTGAIHRVCHDTPRSIREVNPEIPEWLVAIIDRLLVKDPADRFQSAGEVAETLAQYLADVQQPSRVRLPSPSVPRARSSKIRPISLCRRAVVAVAAAVCLGLVLLVLAELTGTTNLRGYIVPGTEPDTPPAEAPELGALLLRIERSFGVAFEVAITGNGNRIVRDAPTQETLQLKPGVYTVELTIPARGRLLRRGTIRIAPGTTQRIACDWLAAGDSPPERVCVAELLGHDAPVRRVAFSRTGKTLFVACQDGQIHVWEGSGSEWRRTRILQGHSGAALSIALLQDDGLLASGGYDGRILLRDAMTGANLRTLTGRASPIRSLAVSPDATRLVSMDDTGTAVVWDLASQTEMQRLEAHRKRSESEVHGPCAAFSPDGRLLVTGGYDETLKLWDANTDANTFRLIRQFPGVSRWVTGLAFSPEGSLILAADAGGTKLWATTTGELLGTLASDWVWTWNVAISPDGRTVASAQSRGVRLFDLASQTMIDAFPAHWDKVNSLAFCPTASLLATAGDDQAVRLWSFRGSSSVQPQKPRPRLLCTFREPFAAFAVNDQRLAFTAKVSRAVYLWNPNHSKLVLRIPEAEGASSAGNIKAIAYRPNGTGLVAVAEDGKLLLWTIDEVRQRFRERGTEVVSYPKDFWWHCVAVSPDGQMIAALDGGGVSLFDSERLTRLGQFELSHGAALSLAFCPQRPILAVGTDNGQLVLWDIAKQETLARFSHGKSRILGLAFSPNGRTLASTSEESTVKLWDVEDRDVATEVRTLKGHTAVVFSADFSPDGKWLVTSGGVYEFQDSEACWQVGKPGEVKIWDTASGELLTDVEAPDMSALDARFSSAGKRLVVASAAALNVWDVTEVLEAASNPSK